MSEAIPVVVEDGVIRPLGEIKMKGRWRGELRVFEEKSSEPNEALKDLRARVVRGFKQNFPHLEFDSELLSLIGVDYAPASSFEEDQGLVMDYLGDKYAKGRSWHDSKSGYSGWYDRFSKRCAPEGAFSGERGMSN